MFRRTWVGLAVIVPILAIAAGVVVSKDKKDAIQSVDLRGEWLLDRSLSDSGRGPGGPGGTGWRRDGRDRGERGGRPARLPERIRIEQTDGSVRIADSTGTPLQEITIGKAAEWGKDGLNVVRDGRRGKMTQTLAIEQDGRVLVIRTKTESNGQRPSREFKRVYRRISA